MALRTLGTNANSSFKAFLVGTDDLVPASVALLMEGILADPPGYGAWPKVNTSGLIDASSGTIRPRVNQAYVQTGRLIIPNRGQLQLKPGDFVAFDPTTGWPIVISGDCAANGAVTHT